MLFSNRDLIKMALPLLIQQVLAVTIGMVDTMMVSYAGNAAVSGVSLVNSLDSMLVIVFTSLTTGGTVVVSQLLGSRNLPAARDGAKQLLAISAAMALLLTVAVQILRAPLLNMLFGSAEELVLNSANEYFIFISLSFPAMAISGACDAIQRTEGKTLTNMLVSLGANVLNILGNALFIMYMNMGAAGAAVATLIARAVSASIKMVLICRKENKLYVDRLLHYRPDFKVIRKILRVGIPNGIEHGMFSLGKLMTQSLISTMPTAMIAANAVANALANYQYMPGTAISNAMLPVVGRCIGANEPGQARRYTGCLLGWNYICLWAVAGVTFLLADPLIGLYNLSGDSGSIAKQLILYHAGCAVLMWPIGFTLPSAFRAAGDVKFPMVVSMLSMWVFRVALAYPMALPQMELFGIALPGLGMGIMGVWVAMTVDWVFRTVLYITHYLRGKWLCVASLVK